MSGWECTSHELARDHWSQGLAGSIALLWSHVVHNAFCEEVLQKEMHLAQVVGMRRCVFRKLSRSS
jgi:hypothetical protein